MTARTRRPVEIESPWLLASEAAAYARCHVDEITDACRVGELVANRRGDRGRWRIHRDDLDRWIRREVA